MTVLITIKVSCDHTRIVLDLSWVAGDIGDGEIGLRLTELFPLPQNPRRHTACSAPLHTLREIVRRNRVILYTGDETL